MKPHVYMASTFFNEIEILLLKIKELEHIVDTFIFVESDLTFSGIKKPLYLDRCDELLAPYEGRIYRVLHKNVPGVNPWINERLQRDVILRITRDLSRRTNWPYQDDVLINADMDEIVSASSVQRWLDGETDFRPTALDMKMYYYYLNNYAEGTSWAGGKIMRLHEELPETLSELRYNGNLPLISNGGWHFSFLGGINRIKEKVISYAHNDLYGFVADTDKLKEDLRTGRDWFSDRNLPFVKVEIDDTYPAYIRENRSLWNDFIMP